MSKTLTIGHEKTTRNALEYINRPPVHIGA